MQEIQIRPFLLVGILSTTLIAQLLASPKEQSFTLSNSRVTCVVQIVDGIVTGDRLIGRPSWLKNEGQNNEVEVVTDAGFGIDVMYANWRAPGKGNNGDNPVILAAQNFRFHLSRDSADAQGAKILTLFLHGVDNPVDVRIQYRLEKESSTLRTNIAVRDTSNGQHFLRWLWPRRTRVHDVRTIVNAGSFGQPVALLLPFGGVFFGLEFPSAENMIDASGLLQCGQEIGERIKVRWIESEWVAEGLVPDTHVKTMFFAYLDEIRAAPLRPYTLYNSWYDLRSPEYPHVPQENVMSEKSALRMVDLLRTNMIQRYGIHLDAFVLDDGWDDYDSDWALRKGQWPNGLRPLADTLRKTNTSLGLWLGPTGGYSFRDRRITWMRNHGYEVVGDQLCVAGEKYSRLLRNRVTDLSLHDNIAYYKWDGMQFACNEPGHGHPIDIYSRRAALNSVIAMCKSVRAVNPKMFLNLTSGTWLSPWWVKYANTIWMDGEDYGFADVPSISLRDAAITYRDFVLYDDFRAKGLWFPMANLMTHGIIKGKLESVGSPAEPLDKFTDDVLLYVARGVSMYELYISPDIMNAGEWSSIAQSIAWGKDRFSILTHTTMVGGNPLQREAYGYVHFNGMHGIVAARNPVVESQDLRVDLSAGNGLDRGAANLVLERVYPTRWIAPLLYQTGDSVMLNLGAFETAVYEIYPLDEARLPLLAGAIFNRSADSTNGTLTYTTYSTGSEMRILNPDKATSFSIDGRPSSSEARLSRSASATHEMVTSPRIVAEQGRLRIKCDFSLSSFDLSVAVLLTPSGTVKGNNPLHVRCMVDGNEIPASQGNPEGRSRWFLVPVMHSNKEIVMNFSTTAGPWVGDAAVYAIGMDIPEARTVVITTEGSLKEPILPPRPWLKGAVRTTLKIGETSLEVLR